MSSVSAPPSVSDSSAEYKLQFDKNPIEKLEFVQDTPRNETVKKWTTDSAEDSKPVKEAETMGMSSVGPLIQAQMEEITKLVTLIKKTHTQDNEIAQVKRQLTAKESVGTNLGAFAG